MGSSRESHRRLASIRLVSSSLDPYFSSQHREWIVVLRDDPLLEGNYRIIGDVNAGCTNFRTTLGDVTVTNSEVILNFGYPTFHVQWVHFKTGQSNEEPRSSELVDFLMLPKNVAGVATQCLSLIHI